jgi:hypothetical protein
MTWTDIRVVFDEQCIPTEKPRHESSRIDGEHDAELHPATVHLCSGFRHPAQQIRLNHRAYGAQQAEYQRTAGLRQR